MKLRMIKDEDIKDVLSIYRPYITNTPITFECTVPSYRKFVKRVHKNTATYPWLVAEVDGRLSATHTQAVLKSGSLFMGCGIFSIHSA